MSLWNGGHMQEALDALDASERICREHGVEFDGGDIRAEILEEMSWNDPDED